MSSYSRGRLVKENGGIINPGLVITGIRGVICGKPIEGLGNTDTPLEDGDILGGGCDVSIAGVAGEFDAARTGGGTVITAGRVAAKTGGTGGAGIPSGSGMYPGAAMPSANTSSSIHFLLKNVPKN